jgi:hypothetical protein
MDAAAIEMAGPVIGIAIETDAQVTEIATVVQAQSDAPGGTWNAADATLSQRSMICVATPVAKFAPAI